MISHNTEGDPIEMNFVHHKDVLLEMRRHYNNHLMEENKEEGNPLKGDLPKPFNDRKTSDKKWGVC